MPKTFYITTAIAYVNSKPHMGHAMEFIEEDALARFHRLIGDDTYALTGTDEHGMKIVQTAKKADVEVQQFVDQNAETFRALKDLLNLSYDQFIRTSDQKTHWPSVEYMWNQLVKSGDIYKGSYEGFYCVGCEAFVPESELIEGKCSIHLTAPEKIKEENYFFKLTKYADRIIGEIESKRFNIVPSFRANEIINVLKQAKDVSFSRPRSVLSWGVPVPGDSDQVMYVWCDALTNYISALGYGTPHDDLFMKYWDNGDQRVQIIGKDILRFHAGIWPAMLMSAGVKLPHTLLVHGFIQMGGEKMSKSRGNVVDPVELVREWGVDPIRWYLLREITMGQDGDFTYERLSELYNSELANTIGNLVQRVCTIAQKNAVSFEVPDSTTTRAVTEAWDTYEKHFALFALQDACSTVRDFATQANQYVDQTKPWELAKADQKQLAQVLSNLVGMIRAISVLLYPLVPHTSTRIRERLGLSAIDPQSFDLTKELAAGTEGIVLTEGEPLFPRR